MAPRRSEHMAVQPLRYLDGAEGEQARGFCLDIVGLDVEVEARCVIDGLDVCDQSRQRLVQPGELGLLGYRAGRDAEGGGPEGGRGGGLGLGGVNQQGVDAALVHAAHGIALRRLLAVPSRAPAGQGGWQQVRGGGSVAHGVAQHPFGTVHAKIIFSMRENGVLDFDINELGCISRDLGVLRWTANNSPPNFLDAVGGSYRLNVTAL